MINEGSFGKVFIAGHRASGDRRAIKQITKRSVSKRHITEFIAEFELLRNLSHPNIIRVYEIYEDKKHYYIVTEY
jgi:calcium-dependent protein kinase